MSVRRDHATALLAAARDLPGFERDGARFRILAGEGLTLSHVEVPALTALPGHHHPQEQMGIVLSGRMRLSIGDTERELTAGDVYRIPPGVPHAGSTGPEGATVLDVFAPVRSDYHELAELG